MADDPFANDDDLFEGFQETKHQQQPKQKSIFERADAALKEQVGEVDYDAPVNLKQAMSKKRKRTEDDVAEDEEEQQGLDLNEEQQQPDATTTDTTPTTPAKKEDVVFMVASREQCMHEVAYPPNYVAPQETQPTQQKKPAKTYPFVLDAFQRESVNCIERSESVLVSAHTSAGKTAVAEYAIAASLRDGSRVIYTSPIKALSNQKYRELVEEFQNVGLMTGDVTINPDASCLVMTTEILRSMLYRGSEILNEVAWVIFDEVHYMRDRERGVVWEETMILLPNTVRYVFLSATIPNAMEFAGWIAKLKGQPVHVVYTDYRPTPLQHYIYPSGGDGIHLVVDEKGRFKQDNFQKAVANLKKSAPSESGRPAKRRRVGGGGQGEQSDIYKIIKMIMERNFQPVIVFSFSRKDCEALAVQMAKMELNDDDEKALVEEVFKNATDSLSDDDKKLPQVEHMLPLLKKGIGIHHSGLLPIIKEVIEILFQEGLVKALFSTETFSMGLNMPARTVVFTQIQKFDGTNFRTITSGEYIQMSGRAGRRGIDDRGIVMLMIDEELEQDVARKMMSGKPDALNSSFHLSYYMILNLLRVEEITPEYIMERSFFQYQSERQRPILEEQLKLVEAERDAIVIENEQQVSAYYNIRSALDQHRNELRQIVSTPLYCAQYLNPGRIVKVRDGVDDWGWGVVVNYQKKKSLDQDQIAMHKAQDYIVDVLLYCTPVKKGQIGKPKPCVAGMHGELQVVPIQLDLIESFSSVRLFLNKNLSNQAGRDSVMVRLNEAKKRFPDGLPVLDPIEDMHIQHKGLAKICEKIATLEERLAAIPIFNAPNIVQVFTQYSAKMKLEEDANTLKKKVKETGQLVLKEELKKMMRVLRRLGCITQDNVMDVKGRVACEISAGDELVLTEMMFNGVFNDMSPEQVVSLMSCMVFDEKSGDAMKTLSNLPDELSKPYKAMQDAAKRVAKVKVESKIELDENEYVNSFSPMIMEITFAWCNGSKFFEICKMSEVFEGSIVRALRRLEELMRQMCVAAKSIGDNVLEEKFLKGIGKLKRDIVFSSSLYL